MRTAVLILLTLLLVSPTIADHLPPDDGPRVGNCPVFPADNPWNQDISALPVHENSDNYIAAINSSGDGFLHPDFGENQAFGIPYVVVPGDQPLVPIIFTEYGDESDPGPYPIPPDAPIEAGTDRHVVVIDGDNCHLYELYHSNYVGDAWEAGSGSVWDLLSNRLRPEGWTSVDAAGLPLFPGLARYDEIEAGAINHALRFTVEQSQRGYIHPATHFASDSDDPNLPPMGLRLRLRADFDLSPYTGASRVILDALARYGMYVSDNGTNWYITGATDPRWNDRDLDQLKTIPGSAFEAVYTGEIVTGN